MELLNAMAKVRFASVKPQRIRLHKAGAAKVELLCLEPGQKLNVASGQWVYYVAKGQAVIAAGETSGELTAGDMAATDDGEQHSISNAGEQRLICIAVGQLP